MGLFGNHLEQMIDQLEGIIPYVDEGFTFGFMVERHDWRPIWALCREIQEEFKGFKGFETREARDAAWTRFNDLRTKASRRADAEKAQIAGQSDKLRIEIVHEARACYWSASADFFVGAVLGETTVEEMKKLQARLNAAGRRFSENKGYMTREHKEECFEAIKDSRESHDRFWEKYNEYRDERRAESQRKRENFERKRGEWLDRLSRNIEGNKEKLSNAFSALSRTQDRIRETESKLEENQSEKWQGIYAEWLERDREKESSIEEQIARIQGWIRDDQEKLRGA